MKAAFITLAMIILVAVLAVSVMVKFASDITMEERRRDLTYSSAPLFKQTLSVKTLHDIMESKAAAERFPYAAAIARNSSSSWSFACFASIILLKWVVTSAHCRMHDPDHVMHRVLILDDFVQNSSRSFPILYWRIHERFQTNSAFFDIAVAKLSIEIPAPFTVSLFDDLPAKELDACIWKTVYTMEKKIFLINDFDEYQFKFAPNEKCTEALGIIPNDSQLCVDMTDYEDCFINEFGPIYSGHKLVGILSLGPSVCEVKYAIFTNVSYFAPWIRKVTHSPPPTIGS